MIGELGAANGLVGSGMLIKCPSPGTGRGA